MTAAATVIFAREAKEEAIGPFVFGTDGTGAKLNCRGGLYRMPKSYYTSVEETDDYGNVRSLDNLYMNGAEVMAFSLKKYLKLQMRF